MANLKCNKCNNKMVVIHTENLKNGYVGTIKHYKCEKCFNTNTKVNFEVISEEELDKIFNVKEGF